MEEDVQVGVGVWVGVCVEGPTTAFRFRGALGFRMGSTSLSTVFSRKTIFLKDDLGGLGGLGGFGGLGTRFRVRELLLYKLI